MIHYRYRNNRTKTENKDNLLHAIKDTHQQIDEFYGKKKNLAQFTPTKLFEHYNYLKYEVKGTVHTAAILSGQIGVTLFSVVFSITLSTLTAQRAVTAQQSTPSSLIIVLAFILVTLVWVVSGFVAASFALWIIRELNDKNSPYEHYVRLMKLKKSQNY